MSESPVAETEEKAKDPNYNENRKVEALMKRAAKAHDWRVQVYAQSERRIKAINAELAALGREEFVPYEPQYDNPEMIEHYATMPLS